MDKMDALHQAGKEKKQKKTRQDGKSGKWACIVSSAVAHVARLLVVSV
jgi:hypothetical protein